MGRSLVCGIDDATGSRSVASIGGRLARDLDSRTVLVRVTEGRRPLGRLSPMAIVRRRSLRRTLRAIVGEHAFPGGTAVRVAVGDPAAALSSIAHSMDAELMVVGAGGDATASDLLLGGVSTHLAREAPCPVVLIPREAIAPLDAEGWHAVVCAATGGPGDADALLLAGDLAERLGGDLHTAQVGDARPADADELMRVADADRAGLIVAPPAEPDDLNRGTLAIQLAARGRTPVVVIPPNARLQPGSGHYELVGMA